MATEAIMGTGFLAKASELYSASSLMSEVRHVGIRNDSIKALLLKWTLGQAVETTLVAD